MDHISNNKRIAKNTLLLYIRMLLLMAISLYTSRVILKTLGVEDFGIYNVVGGVVTMFSVISGALSASISRFLTYELGKQNAERLNRIFSTALIIQFGISIIIILAAETIGIWFLNYEMNIPADRLYAANWVFQFSIFSFIVSLISLPYNALIIAHEKMSVFAYISILEAILKLVGIFLLVLSPVDRLISYAVLTGVIAVLVRCIYSLYCRRKFEECRFRFIFDHGLLKSMCAFAGWNFYGSSSILLREQGVNIVLNIFCGPSINAARGIAVQVNNAVSSFISNFMTALDPQIVKSYASMDKRYMYSLIYQGTKFSFYLMLCLSLPVLFNTDSILEFWLGEIPTYCASFVQLMLLLSLIDCLYRPLLTAHLATGKIKRLQMIVGGINLLNLPLSFGALALGYTPTITIVISIVLSVVALSFRLILFSKIENDFCIKDFVRNVMLKIIYVSGLSLVLPIIGLQIFSDNIVGILMECFICLFSVGIVVYYVGISIDERKKVNKKMDQLIKRL